MKNWISKLGGRDNLDAEERQTYDEYYDILSRELTLEDLEDFFTAEIANLSSQLRDAVKAGEDRKALLLAARIENTQTWLDFIQAPQREKDALIEHITNSLIST